MQILVEVNNTTFCEDNNTTFCEQDNTIFAHKTKVQLPASKIERERKSILLFNSIVRNKTFCSDNNTNLCGQIIECEDVRQYKSLFAEEIRKVFINPSGISNKQNLL